MVFTLAVQAVFCDAHAGALLGGWLGSFLSRVARLLQFWCFVRKKSKIL